MLAAVSFFSSLSLLMAFLGFRVWEGRRGARMLDALRSRLDERVSEAYRAAVMGGIPTSWRHSVIAFAHSLTHRTVLFLVDLVHRVEKPLAKLSVRMRIQKLSPNGKEVSSFLKSITPEKDGSQKTTDTL